MKKILTTFLTFLGFIIYAQSNQDLHYYFKNLPNSPSTTTFLRYGDIQNSEFTGTNAPKISLYTVQEGDITLALTLDYLSGNGVKVTDEATSVGIGWNIGLPVIVQSVLVEDDLLFNNSIIKLKIDLHHQNAPWPALNYNGKYLESKEGQQPAGYIGVPEIGKYTYQYSVGHVLPVNGLFQGYPTWWKYDTSPDIFNLNLFGEKLEFFIGNHKNLTDPSVAPEFICLKKGYKVSFNQLLFTFNITAPSGIVYTFGKVEEISSNSSTLNRNFVLTGIKDKNNKTIQIEYNEHQNVKNFIPNSKNLNYNKAVTENYTSCDGIPFYYISGPAGGYIYSTKLNGVSGQSAPFFETQGVGQYHIPTVPHFVTMQNYLLVSKISGEFGTLNFNYTSREDFPTAKLSEIKVKNNINNDVKTIAFDYSYATALNSTFYNAPSDLFDENRMRKRLFLKNLSINQDEHFTFSYKNEFLLPRKDSYAVDYWGYYNAGNSNKTYFLNPANLTNSTLPITDVNNNKKVADINYTTAGLLERINYPTQGSSIFTYESNSADNLFSNYNPSTIDTGKGVRLKSQTNIDLQGNLVEKTQFIYEEGYSTNPLDLITAYTTRFIQANNHHIFGTEVISMNSTNNYSTSPLSSGDIVGYKKVIKIQIDSSGNDKGEIISTYSINPDVFYHFSPYQVPVSIPRTKAAGVESGLLLSQEYLNSNNQTIRRIINEYNTKYSDIYYGTMFTPINEYLYICVNITNGPTSDYPGFKPLSVVSNFPIFSKESLLSNSKTTDFFEGKEVINTLSNTYDNNNLLTQKSILNSTQDQLSESYSYSSQIPRFSQKNILSEPTGKIVYKNGRQILRQITNYDNLNHFNPTSIVSNDLLNSTTSVGATYDLYDTNKLLQYTNKEGIPATIIWGYKGTQPIAHIQGATYSQIMQAFGLNVNNTSYQDLDIVKKSDQDVDNNSEAILISKLNEFKNKIEFKDFKISTYTYDPLIGVKTITQPSGITEFYKYNVQNKLEKIIDSENNIVKEYKYNFAPKLFYNSAKSQPFTRNNCGSNAIGGTYTYSVPENKYSSYVSKDAADQLAQNEINANGQNSANVDGTCTPISCSIIKGSGLVNLYYTSIGINPNNLNMYRIQMGFPLDAGLPWKTSGVIIGRVTGSCMPTTVKNSSCYYQGIWSITINTSGDIIAKKIDGSDNFGSTMSLDFTLLIN